jgi:acetate kinase
MTRVLVVNAGSSSLKLSALDAGTREPLAAASASWGADATRAGNPGHSLRAALDELVELGVETRSLEAAAHRIVHGGERFREPVRVDDDVLAELDELRDLAPLHNGVALETLRAQRELLADVPAFAVFDTAFHASLAQEAFVYPLPWHWYAKWGVRRYGFHGLSVEWAVRRSSELLSRPAEELSLVVAHLGSGCSVTAVEAGRSVSTSMGMTPLEGLMMGSRPGSVDPGVLLYVLRERGVSPAELAEALDHEAGLLGISGVSGDVRDVTAAAAAGSARARLALEMFARRAAESIASAATSLTRLDALVFTGGIGQNAAQVRADVCGRLGVVGVPRLDLTEMLEHDDAVLARSEPGVAVVRIQAREDIVMAEAAARALGATQASEARISGQ